MNDKRNFAIAVLKDKSRRARAMFWKGGRAAENHQDEDLAPDGRNQQHGDSGEPKSKHLKAFADGGEVERPADTSGHPQTSDAGHMRANQYDEGGEVADTSGVPQTDNPAAERRGQYAMGGEVQHQGYAVGGEVQHAGYARGGYVQPPVHKEEIERFGPEPKEDYGDDPMKMVAALKKRRRRF